MVLVALTVLLYPLYFTLKLFALHLTKMLIIMVESQRNKTQDISNDTLTLCRNMREEAFEYGIVS